MDEILSPDMAVETVEALWRNSQDAWFIVSVGGDDFCYHSANTVYLSHFGNETPQLIGRPMRDVLPPGEYDMCVTPFRQCLRQGRPLHYEFRAPQGDGFRDWSFELSPLQGQGGRICFLLGHGRDITDARLAREQLAQLRRDLTDIDAGRCAFLANISHEMRTPVSGLAGAVELLMAAGQNTEQQHLAAMIRDSSDTLSQLMADILDYARLSSGAVKLDYQRFSLGQLIEDLAARKQILLSRNSLHLRLLLKAVNGIELYGDAPRISQLLEKLLDNAIKFTRDGEVSVTAQVAVREGNARLVTVRVRDTGCGIDISRLDDVFKPFRQLDDSSTRRYGGAGLGLAIAKQLIDLMRGDIQVVSQAEEGSEFVIRLPLLLDESHQVFAEHIVIDRSVLSGARVLVVEDNPINKLVTERLLNQHGLNVHSAANGKDALSVLAQHPIDIVLMDWQMPLMDGAEATRKIRSMPGMEASLPIIGLTAGIDHADVRQCQEAGMNDVLPKPLESSTLLDRMAHWLSLR
ncbi:Autoinducer 2 sensor kinase/phosphatase LuxQ [BD1-7 clade bacterium]|uniref:histidine kinase n=1 Tax=BD1-7 clade bacterium TaxID=2029982 RepID=A0A5S9QE30_9GAMM|nr:Autoinducer 2 sensor kinase/phosphatase LuxQ [BD1-7 clade bacterium]